MQSTNINTTISSQTERVIALDKCIGNTKRYKSKKKLSTELNTLFLQIRIYFRL